jgi:hypothetical protein
MRGIIIQFQPCQGISLDFPSPENINLHPQIHLERNEVSKHRRLRKLATAAIQAYEFDLTPPRREIP